ncbi:MAG: ABC transporter ATP-binding protein, partial [Roseiflexaceae bacterium]
MSTPIIRVADVSFTYRGRTQPAIDAVSFALHAGSITAIIGKAGAGKSTLCALIAGFMPQFFRGKVSGTLSVDGRDPCTSSIIEMLPHVTMVTSQASTQISGVCFTVAEEVGFALQNLGYSIAEINQRVARALALMDISHLGERSPFQLSGGQQQRVVIAAALALSPPILILDEPTAQLDPPAVAALGETLRNLARSGQTIVVAEHHLDWVGEFAERVIVLHEGRLHADGAPDVILADPAQADGSAYCVRYSGFARQHGLWPTDTALAITPAAICTRIRVDVTPAQRVAPMATAGAELLHIDNVHFSYPSGGAVLHGINLRIHRGERIALLGRNGAGKSTLLRHFNGLLRPQTGRVALAGRDIAAIAPGLSARHASIVFQDVRNQLFAATIRDEVSFGPRT